MNGSSMRGFSETVEREFAFLEEHGFVCASVSRSKVRYESGSVYIEVSYGERDGEISISFGRIKQGEEFSFTLFLRLTDLSFERSLGERIANNADEMRGCIRILADALRTRGQDIIAGQDRIFERMRDVRWWDFEPDALKDG